MLPPQIAALVGITSDPYPQALFDTANNRIAFGKLGRVVATGSQSNAFFIIPTIQRDPTV